MAYNGEKELRKMIERASGFAEAALRDFGEVAPIWHMITEDGKEFVELTPQLKSKDDAVAMIRALMEVTNVVRYVYFAEAWMLDLKAEGTTAEAMAHARTAFAEGLSDHPDRIEIVRFQAESLDCRTVTGHRRIIREKHRAPRLGPLEIVDTTQSEGRMVAMLPRPKGRALQ